MVRPSLLSLLALAAVASPAVEKPSAQSAGPRPPPPQQRQKAPAPCKVEPAKCPPQPAAKPPARPTKSRPVPLSCDETLLLELLNAERARHRLPPLRLDATLTRVAREHCADMAKRGYFSHFAPGPEPRSPLARYAAALGKKPTEVVGENLGAAAQPLMGALHECLMNSPDHCANILDREYTRVGVGLLVQHDGRTWLTQMFCGESRSPVGRAGPSRSRRGGSQRGDGAQRK